MAMSNKEAAARLDSLADALTSIALEIADPTRWAGHGETAKTWDSATKKQRALEQYDASMTLKILGQVHNLADKRHQLHNRYKDPTKDVPTDDIEARVSAVAKRAADAVAKATAHRTH